MSCCSRDSDRCALVRTALEPALFWTVAALDWMGNLLVLWVYLCRGRGLCHGGGLLTHSFFIPVTPVCGGPALPVHAYLCGLKAVLQAGSTGRACARQRPPFSGQD
uniref:Uncharacterized protein n=1 Tax=Knipowitschia caucasica TaxID=637954 RepID=A0AAV2JHL1_KNICA